MGGIFVSWFPEALKIVQKSDLSGLILESTRTSLHAVPPLLIYFSVLRAVLPGSASSHIALLCFCDWLFFSKKGKLWNESRFWPL